MKVTITAIAICLLSSISFAQDQSTATLSEARSYMNTTLVGSKIIFAGGVTDRFQEVPSSTVDIYDTETDEWTAANLSSAGWGADIASGAVGDVVIFVTRTEDEHGGEDDYLPVVDMYNAESGSWSNPELSDDRYFPTVKSLNDKIVIAGGRTNSGTSDRVDIFDISAQSWSQTTLSEARYLMSTITAGSKIIFAGGATDRFAESPSAAVDIYNTETNEWTAANLSAAVWEDDEDTGIAGSAGHFVIFVTSKEDESGGEDDYIAMVDMYNAETGNWSKPELSDDRFLPTIASLNDKIVFAGGRTNSGSSDRVDIFDISTQTWSQATLSEARYFKNAVTVGSKIIFSGGVTDRFQEVPSSAIDIYDTVKDEWTSYSLSEAGWGVDIASGAAGDIAIFVSKTEDDNGGEDDYLPVVDMYNAETGSWSNPELSNDRYFPTVAVLNDRIVFAGGVTNSGTSDQVDIFTVELPTSIEETDALPRQVLLNQNYPNPFNPATTISFELRSNQPVQLEVFDISGRKVANLIDNSLPAGIHHINFEAQGLSSGVYFYHLSTGGESFIKAMTLIK